MATSRDLANLLISGAEKIARKVDAEPTGVNPGYRAGLAGTVLPNGKLLYASDTAAGGGGGVRTEYASGVSQTFATSSTVRRLIQFDTQEHLTGSGGAVTTGASWKFTNTGAATVYLVSVCIHIDLFAWAAASRGELTLHLLGTTTPVRYLNRGNGFGNGTNSYTRMIQGTTTILLQTNDYIDVRLLQNTGSTLSLTGSADQNYIDIAALS